MIANRSFENVSQFKYLGTKITSPNLIQGEIKRRLNSDNACYHLVQSLLSSRLLSENLKIRIYKMIILPVVLYGCETWSLTLREEHKLRVFENRVLRRIFGPMRDEVTGEWRKLHKEDLRDLYSSPSIIRIMKSRKMRWAGHVARLGEKRKVYRSGHLWAILKCKIYLGHQSYIHINLLFWQFCRHCLYVVDMIPYYIVTYLNNNLLH
jgi:hypothetical protein